MSKKKEEEQDKKSTDEKVEPTPKSTFQKPVIKVIEIDISHLLYARDTT